jgi:hypothetical protein
VKKVKNGCAWSGLAQLRKRGTEVVLWHWTGIGKMVVTGTDIGVGYEGDDDPVAASRVVESTLSETGMWIPLNEGSWKSHRGENGDGKVETPGVTWNSAILIEKWGENRPTVPHWGGVPYDERIFRKMPLCRV